MWRRLPIARVQLLCPVWVGLILLRGLVPTLGSTASLLLDTPKFTSGMDTPLSDISYHCTEEAGVVSSSVSSSRFVSPGPAPIRNGPKGEGSARSQKALPGCFYHRGTVERAMVQNWLFFFSKFYLRMLYCRRKIQIWWLSSYVFYTGTTAHMFVFSCLY